MRKALSVFVRTACAVGVVALAMSTSANAQVKKYTFGYDQPHSTAYGIAADMFNAKLMELSKGTMGIDQFPGAQLGQEPVMLREDPHRRHRLHHHRDRQRRVGGAAGRRVLRALYLPRQEPSDACAGRSGGDEGIRGDDRRFGQGRACARPDDHGLRNMYSKLPIHSVADVKGEKIRVQATMTEDAHFPAYGAQTVHMPFGEVYTSLQTGVVAHRGERHQRLHGE